MLSPSMASKVIMVIASETFISTAERWCRGIHIMHVMLPCYLIIVEDTIIYNYIYNYIATLYATTQ